MPAERRRETDSGMCGKRLVGETERELRYQKKHMSVCDEWMHEHQAGWHRRS